MPARSAWPAAAQPATDLARRPAHLDLARDHGPQRGIDHDPVLFGPLALLESPSVRVVRLVDPIGFPAAVDLPVDALVRRADPCRDLFDRLPSLQPVSDLDPIVLGQVAAADGRVDEFHAASVDEPQRPAARRHADTQRRSMAADTLPQQHEELALGQRI